MGDDFKIGDVVLCVDEAIAAIPEGWRIYTIDMSIEGRARVMLKGPMYLNAAGVSVPEYACDYKETLPLAINAVSTIARNTYRGWSTTWDYGQFTATGPDYEPDYNDEDGFFNPPGAQIAYGRTLDSVHAEIDAWFAERLSALTPKEDNHA